MSKHTIEIDGETHDWLTKRILVGGTITSALVDATRTVNAWESVQTRRVRRLLAVASADADAVAWAEQQYSRLRESAETGTATGYVVDDMFLQKLSWADLRMAALMQQFSTGEVEIVVPVEAWLATLTVSEIEEEELLNAVVHRLPGVITYNASTLDDVVQWANWRREYDTEDQYDIVMSHVATVAQETKLPILTTDAGRWKQAAGGIVPPAAVLWELKLP